LFRSRPRRGTEAKPEVSSRLLEDGVGETDRSGRPEAPTNWMSEQRADDRYDAVT